MARSAGPQPGPRAAPEAMYHEVVSAAVRVDRRQIVPARIVPGVLNRTQTVSALRRVSQPTSMPSSLPPMSAAN